MKSGFQSGQVFLRIELKVTGIPVAFKGRLNLVQYVGQILAGYFQVPLKPVDHGCPGEIRGSHIGSGKAAVPVKDPRLGVHAGTVGIIADFDFGIGQLAQGFYGTFVCGACVGRRDDAYPAATPRCFFKRRADEADAAPFEEGNQDVYAVGRNDFLYDFLIDLGVAAVLSRKQETLGQGCLRALKIGSFLLCGEQGILFSQYAVELACILVVFVPDVKAVEIAVVGSAAYAVNDFVAESYLGLKAPFSFPYRIQPLVDDCRQVLGKHLRRIAFINFAHILAFRGNAGQFILNPGVDNLFVEAWLQRHCISLLRSEREQWAYMVCRHFLRKFCVRDAVSCTIDSIDCLLRDDNKRLQLWCKVQQKKPRTVTSCHDLKCVAIPCL